MTPTTDMESRIIAALDGYDERELAAVISIERAFAAHLCAGGQDTEEARSYITGSDREPHWRWGWEYARGDLAEAA